MNQDRYDIIFAGGGLSTTLAAYRLSLVRPELRLLIIEAGASLGGNHTWSFHRSDVNAAARPWLLPFIDHSWPLQCVRFPKYKRTLSIGYNTVSSEKLHEVASKHLSDRIVFNARVRALSPHRVELEDGRNFEADCVVDGRGSKGSSPLTLGYQKFLGLEVRCAKPHGQAFPILMDATVPQRDGYRFVYTLPFGTDRILIEDTYYSDTPDIDEERLRAECRSYADKRGWTIAEVVREEKGVLPIILSGDVEALIAQTTPGVPSLGVRAGFFHHTTSYSLPFAVRLADKIAAFSPLTSEALEPAIKNWMREHWRDQSYFRLLNRMLFWAAEGDGRYRILERFYGLGEPLISRFYSASLTSADHLRILLGRPPVPFMRALRVLKETKDNPFTNSEAA